MGLYLKKWRWYIVLWVIGSSTSLAKGPIKNLKEGRFLFAVAGDLNLSSSKADEETGGRYDLKLKTYYTVSPSVGWRLFPWLYVGLRYEYFVGQRIVTFGSTEQTDTLGAQLFSGELGYYTGNPRVHYLVTGGVAYPLVLKVTSTNGLTYLPTTKSLYYHVRAMVGFKFTSNIAFNLYGGYRLFDLGQLKSGANHFLRNQDKVNLSGPYLGIGLGFHF